MQDRLAPSSSHLVPRLVGKAVACLLVVVRVVLVLVVQLRLLAEARLTLLLQVVLCALPLAMVHLVVI